MIEDKFPYYEFNIHGYLTYSYYCLILVEEDIVEETFPLLGMGYSIYMPYNFEYIGGKMSEEP